MGGASAARDVGGAAPYNPPTRGGRMAGKVISDEGAKRVLAVAIVLGSVLGFLWGAPRYGAVHVSTWSLMGLGVMGLVGCSRQSRTIDADKKTDQATGQSSNPSVRIVSFLRSSCGSYFLCPSRRPPRPLSC